MAPKKRLDRKRDFGEICGGGLARYEQDGALFDVNGKLVKSAEAAAVNEDDDDDDNSGGDNGLDEGVAGGDENTDTEFVPTELDLQVAAQLEETL